ncbi:MAG: hypothetical protein A2163_03995 [Actinobacteria bacterium RBG_13_35_12]|nr:MAG: hypothetical protein A2163_03995 [Actinobacteria bacterium RBG_13_35_12]
MAVTIEQIIGIEHGGIYYTDQVNGVAGEGTLTLEKLVFTDDVDLIDTRINQVSARHLRPANVIVRTTT